MERPGLAWTCLITAAALSLIAALPAGADEQAPYRVRGTLEAVEGDKLTVATREGETIDLTLTDDIFAEELRGTAEGHGPWDLVKKPNTMTNATVAQIKEVGDQRELKVSYQEGQGEQKTEGSQTIYVPEELSVVRMEKAGDRAVLAPGKDAFVVVREEAEGSRTALAVIVGEEGAAPPM